MCSLLVFALIAGWESKETSYKDLPDEYIARLDFAIGVGVLGFLYALFMTVAIILDVKFKHLYAVVRSRETSQ